MMKKWMALAAILMMVLIVGIAFTDAQQAGSDTGTCSVMLLSPDCSAPPIAEIITCAMDSHGKCPISAHHSLQKAKAADNGIH